MARSISSALTVSVGLASPAAFAVPGSVWLLVRLPTAVDSTNEHESAARLSRSGLVTLRTLAHGHLGHATRLAPSVPLINYDAHAVICTPRVYRVSRIARIVIAMPSDALRQSPSVRPGFVFRARDCSVPETFRIPQRFSIRAP